MKSMKVLGVILLFGIAIYMGLGLKKRIVQSTCDEIGDYKATKGEELMDASDKEIWYCCPPKSDKNTKTCLYYGD